MEGLNVIDTQGGFARNANTLQIGGMHYKAKDIQPWDYIAANQIGYLAGNAIKYLSRYKEKGGADDIKKAIHYCHKILEMEYPNGNEAG